MLENRGCWRTEGASNGVPAHHIFALGRSLRNGGVTEIAPPQRVWKGEKTGNKLTRDNQMEGAGGMQYKQGNPKRIHVICWETINDAEPRTRERVC